MKNNQILFILFISLGMISYAQETEEEVNPIVEAIAADSCECLVDIKLDAAKKKRYNSINDCIETASNTIQMTEGIKNTLGIGKDSTITNDIIIEKNKYKREVQSALLERCPKMKLLMSSDEVESEVSISEKKKAVEFYDQGMDFYVKEDYKNAIKFYKKAVNKDKNFAFAWDNLGLSYRKDGQFKKAIEAYDKSIELDPTGAVPLMNKPIAFLMDGKLQEAILAYQDYIRVFPNDAEGYYGISRVYIETKEFEKALDNILNAFVKYNEVNSPYARDAEHVIQVVYNNLKENDMLSIWDQYLKKYDITVGE